MQFSALSLDFLQKKSMEKEEHSSATQRFKAVVQVLIYTEKGTKS
jgi:hypothetical protein